MDAIGSGKTKQLIQNSKSLAWQGIELAVDPSTIMALAEVTAHLCHALEELDDSFHPTPRVVRNTQNESSYLQSIRMTDYHPECMENIILSSLGMQLGAETSSENDDTFLNDGMSVGSIPSNVAFLQETPSQVDTRAREQTERRDHSSWEKCKEKVDVDLLRRQILQTGRPLARSTFPASDPGREALSTSMSPLYGNGTPAYGNLMPDARGKRSASINLQDKENDGDEEKLYTDDKRNAKELFDSFEKQNVRNDDKNVGIEFYRMIDDILQQQRRTKDLDVAKIRSQLSPTSRNDGRFDVDGDGYPGSQKHPGIVRRFQRGGEIRTERRSREFRKQYSNLRRIGKYPPFLLYSCGALLAFVLLFWIGFGLFGFYTFYRGLSSKNFKIFEVSEDHMPGSGQARPNNEIVIRVVKQMEHATDGESNQGQRFEESGFSDEELIDMLQCLGRN